MAAVGVVLLLVLLCTAQYLFVLSSSGSEVVGGMFVAIGSVVLLGVADCHSIHLPLQRHSTLQQPLPPLAIYSRLSSHPPTILTT